MQAHLDRDSGLWDEPELWGANSVLVNPEESSIVVRNYDEQGLFFALRQDYHYTQDLL